MNGKVEMRGLKTFRIAGWALVGLLLLAPAVAMRFTSEVQWSGGDFIAAAILLGGAGLAIEGLMRVSDKATYRVGAALGVLSLLFLVWANLAVGIVGSERDPFNHLYFLTVPLIGLGAPLVRLRPRGMTMVMALVAAVPAVLAIAALALGKQDQPMDSVREILLINGLFVTLFASSALCFRAAARD
jgi:hypothetical protein